LNAREGATYSAARMAARVAALGKEISRECGGRRLDVTMTLDRGFVAADLLRHMDAPMVCHCVREEVRDVDDQGRAREVSFGSHPELKGREVLLWMQCSKAA